MLVQHAADHIAQRPANRRTLAVFRAAMPVGDVDRGFSRAIAVVQLHRRQRRQHAITQLGGQGFAAGEQTTQAGAFGHQWFINEQLQQRRHKVQRGHAMRLHQLRDALRITVLAWPRQHQTATGNQRPEAFPHRHVETDRRFLQQHIAVVQLISGLHPLQAFSQGRMGIAHTFGLAGGTGGINHVGEVVAIEVQARCLGGPAVEVQAVHGDHAHALGRRQECQQ